jgi:hypothetical protein
VAECKIDVLQQALSVSRGECARLRAAVHIMRRHINIQDFRTKLTDLPPLKLPHYQKHALDGIVRDAHAVTRQVHLAAATAKVVDLTKSRKVSTSPLALRVSRRLCRSLLPLRRIMCSNPKRALSEKEHMTCWDRFPTGTHPPLALIIQG